MVAVVALWVLGPDQLPMLAKIAYRYMNKIKRSWEEIKLEILQEKDRRE